MRNNAIPETKMRTTALKQTPRRRCHVSQVPLFYRPSGVASSFSMPLYRPFPRSPPPLSLAPALSVFFPAGGCPFLSLSASDLELIVARGPLLPLLLPFSSIQVSISLPCVFFPLYFFLPPLTPPFPPALSIHFASFDHSCSTSS